MALGKTHTISHLYARGRQGEIHVHSDEGEEEEVSTREVEDLRRGPLGPINAKETRRERTKGHLNFLLPLMYCQSKEKEVKNSHLAHDETIIRISTTQDEVRHVQVQAKKRVHELVERLYNGHDKSDRRTTG